MDVIRLCAVSCRVFSRSPLYWGGCYGWCVGSWSAGWLRGFSRVCSRFAPRVFVATFLFEHSQAILMWGVADDRWVYEEARIDSYVCVSVEKEDARIAEGGPCSVWPGLRDV